MVHFNELYVTEDGKHLVIDTEVDNFSVYDSCFIDAITVGIGSDCTDGVMPNNSVTIYTADYIVGDLTGDGRLSDTDIAYWRELLHCAGSQIYDDEQGYYYMTERLDDDGEYVVDEYGSIIYDKVRLSNTVLSTIQHIKAKYTGAEYDSSFGTNNGFGYGKLLAYIVDILGDNVLEDRHPVVPGDLDGNGQVNIGDINYFINYLNRQVSGEAEAIYSKDKKRHVQLCIDTNDESIAALLGSKVKDMSKYLFIITVSAGGYKESISSIASAGCTFDEPEITGVAYNGKPLYDSAVRYAQAFGDSCDSHDASAFNDFLMRYYGFLFALKCGDLCTAQYYWNNYLNGIYSTAGVNPSKGCGCHGLYR